MANYDLLVDEIKVYIRSTDRFSLADLARSWGVKKEDFEAYADFLDAFARARREMWDEERVRLIPLDGPGGNYRRAAEGSPPVA